MSEPKTLLVATDGQAVLRSHDAGNEGCSVADCGSRVIDERGLDVAPFVGEQAGHVCGQDGLERRTGVVFQHHSGGGGRFGLGYRCVLGVTPHVAVPSSGVDGFRLHG